MKTNYVKIIIYSLCFCFVCNVYGDDICDNELIDEKLKELENKSEYNDCNLNGMKKSFYDSSHELIEILQILDGRYYEIMKSENDESSAIFEFDEFVAELNSANNVALKGENIDLNTDSGINELRLWVTNVDTHSKGPMVRINNVKGHFTEKSEKFTFCQAESQWKISKKWRNRILSCVNKANTSKVTEDTQTPE